MKPRGKTRKASYRGGNELKRLPRDFSWRLLDSLLTALSQELPQDFVAEVSQVLRKRDPRLYHEIGARWGLQCMSPAKLPYSPHKVAGMQLILSLAKKEPSLETKSPSERKDDCIQGILREEESLVGRKIHRESVLSLAKAICVDVLGQCPDTDEIAMSAKHGPGVSIGASKGFESSYFKFSQWPYRVSPIARSLLRDVIRSDERWMGALEDSYRTRYGIPFWSILNWEIFWDKILEDCPFNRITTVPKDGTKDRPIAIEPGGSVYLQLGIERCIRRRLKLVGLDLNDQVPNQILASLGSVDASPEGPATIDLSNASDTISLELVRELLPPDWFELLNSVRSPWGVLPDGTALRYAKFSSMGNGATFVLESLIFYSLAKAISYRFGSPRDAKAIRVYGDDIVIPRYLWIPLKCYLESWGFRVNTRKSFVSGPVRESCGADFYYGHNVRPVFLKRIPRDLSELVGIRNRLHRWFVLHTGLSIPQELDDFFLKFVKHPRRVPIGPETEDEFDTFWHSTLTGRMPEFVRVRAYRRVPVRLPAREFHFRKLMHNLLHIGSSSGRFEVTMRGEGTLRQACRVVYRSFYRDWFGRIQDCTRHRHGGMTPTLSAVKTV